MRTALKAGLLSLILLLYLTPSKAQDIHYSQFWNNPDQTNPASIGSGKEHLWVALSIKEQWSQIPVPYSGRKLSFFQDIQKSFLGVDKFTFFSSILHDSSGDASYSNTQLRLGLNGHLSLASNQTLGLNISFDYANRQVDMSKLRYGSQFDGELFRSDIDPQDPAVEFLKNYGSLHAGLNYRLSNEKGVKLQLGLAGFQLNKPSTTELNVSYRPIRWSSTFAYWFYLSEQTYIRSDLNFQVQGPYSVLLVGGSLGFKITPRGQEEVGLYYRNKDALFIYLSYRSDSYKIGFSYDINLSENKVATQGRGGPELFINYFITKVDPIKTIKACPIY